MPNADSWPPSAVSAVVDGTVASARAGCGCSELAQAGDLGDDPSIERHIEAGDCHAFNCFYAPGPAPLERRDAAIMRPVS